MRSFIVGNWKMNQTRSEIEAFFKELAQKASLIKHCEAWVAPQFLHLDYVKSLAHPFGMQVGAQNCATEEKGAYTGEVSPVALRDSGCSFVILGHSERRSYYGEDDKIINKKLHLALKQGLTVIYCCGEKLEEREAGRAQEVVRQQVLEGLSGIENKHLSHLMIAYEPVWAIGTGRTASPEQAQEMHAFLRHLLVEEMKLSEAKALPLLYGGSVTPANVDALLGQQDINGALVGGASLKPLDYVALCQASVK